jgi:hypothetical protein
MKYSTPPKPQPTSAILNSDLLTAFNIDGEMTYPSL